MYVGRVCTQVGGGVFGVRARLQDQGRQLCGVSEVNSEVLLKLSCSGSSFGFSVFVCFFRFVFESFETLCTEIF